MAASYGALHALAWNAKFPTHRERKLWRISAIVIASPPVLYFLQASLVQVTIAVRSCCIGLGAKSTHKPAAKLHPDTIAAAAKSPAQDTVSSKSYLDSISEIVSGVVQALTVAVLLILYLPARVYLVYESFRTVFYLPPEAYLTTGWPQYLPHIT